MHNATIQLPAFRSKRKLCITPDCASGYGVMPLSISITKNMPDTDSPINFVVAPSLIDTKTKWRMNVP